MEESAKNDAAPPGHAGWPTTSETPSAHPASTRGPEGESAERSAYRVVAEKVRDSGRGSQEVEDGEARGQARAEGIEAVSFQAPAGSQSATAAAVLTSFELAADS